MEWRSLCLLMSIVSHTERRKTLSLTKHSVQSGSSYQTTSGLSEPVSECAGFSLCAAAAQVHRCWTLAEQHITHAWFEPDWAYQVLHTHVALCLGFSRVDLWTSWCLVEPSHTSNADIQIKLELLLCFILRHLSEREAAVLHQMWCIQEKAACMVAAAGGVGGG